MPNLTEYKIEVDRSRDYGVFENLSEAQTFQQFLEAKKAAKESEDAGAEGKENANEDDDDAKEGKEKVDEDGEGNEE